MIDDTRSPPRGNIRGSTARVIEAQRQAHDLRRQADRADSEATADELDEAANRLAAEARGLQVAPLIALADAGEAIPPLGTGQPTFLRETLVDPDMTAVEASIDRCDILTNQRLGVTALALDAAATIKPRNSLEKMLAHQLALAHKAAFRMLGDALAKEHSIDQVRLTNAAARLMETYQQGLLTLQKIRTGGRQVIRVENVNVAPGGQAVVGNVRAGGNRRGGGRQK